MTSPEMHVYESSTLGMPPLKMILVHARNEAQNAAAECSAPTREILPLRLTTAEREEVIRRLIERLEETD